MRTLSRIAAVGVMTALTVAVAACSNNEAPSTQAASSSAVAPAAPSAPATTPDDGVTTQADVFGPACSQLPQGDAPGSLSDMGAQPVATAASSNPLLTTLTKAIGAVPGLADTLNAQQGVTVFAPADPAFQAVQQQLGDTAFNALLADPNKLGALLQYHVVGTRYDAESLVAAGRTTQLAGGTLKIGGTPTAPTITDGKGETATVLCGNIPTKNATVFVIDKVLMPAS
ncbi:fasciclin domain-containing protein [Pseudonocardia benzenivorans]|uniref:Fasciclin domain-containing protein n=2 Tax=Pseudonocardia TaxID=1847 RepID=A0ABW3VJ67_9PSEU|nr:fasciclin [Pseudonocardia sp. D17]